MKECGEYCKYWKKDTGEYCTVEWCLNKKAIKVYGKYLQRLHKTKEELSLHEINESIIQDIQSCPYYIKETIPSLQKNGDIGKWKKYYKTHRWDAK